jgi:uroporphyrinogen-III synthase
MIINGSAQPLRGRAVLITRPSHQAERLARLISEAGGEAVRFPALAIEPPADLDRAREVLHSLRSFDLAVFISVNAVDHGLALLGGSWPASVAVAAVGEGSAAALHRHGIASVIVPSSGADSESLLAAPELENLQGKRVLILRGEGGRELLAGALRQLGANVAYAECYRRVRPCADPGTVITRWEGGGLHAVTVMSGETLDNLQAMLGPPGRRLLRATPLFVPHASIAERAERIGATEVTITPPGDEGVMRGLCAWFSLHPR